MCCPKRFDTKPWAFASAYTTFLMYLASFLMFVPFVFHPGLFDQYSTQIHPSSPLSHVTNLGRTMYGVMCFMCFGSLFVVFLSILCIIGVHKERSGFLIPYLVVKSIIALLVVGGSFFVFHALRVMDEYRYAVSEVNEEMTTVSEAVVVLLVLFLYWVFVTPIVVVSTHCHRIIHGTTNGYAGAPLIAMEVPPANEAPPYNYPVKFAGSV